MNIKGIDKAKILMVLYNNSHPLGMGFLQYNPEPMTYKEAKQIIKKTKKFDYLYGRVMKIDLSGDELRTYLYNRDNGEGRAEQLIEEIK